MSEEAQNEAQENAGERAEPDLAADAAQFVRSVAVSDLYEIEAGRLAQSRAASEAVREASSLVARDHLESSRKLKEQAAVSRLPLPSRLDSRHAGLIDQLRAAPSERFDRIWLDQQIAVHREAVTLMRRYRKEGRDAGMRRFAGEALPIMESHLARMEMLV